MFAATNFGHIVPVGTFKSATQTGDFVSIIVGIITIVAGLYFLVNFAMGGLSYATSAGDEKELAKARKTLSNALLGFLLVVSSYFIVGFMGKRLGFSTLFTPSIQGTGAGGYYCLNIQVVGTATQPTDILLRGETSSGATYDLFVTQVRADTIISGVTFEASNTVYSSYILAYDGPAVHVVKTLGHSDLQLNNCVDVSN